MCSEYTLKKYPCDVDYYNYKDLDFQNLWNLYFHQFLFFLLLFYLLSFYFLFQASIHYLKILFHLSYYLLVFLRRVD